ncbi:putrescine/spermidine ABC transporter|nr:putrescine/spermidine ABC transporter [Candidatus Pantoea persica]
MVCSVSLVSSDSKLMPSKPRNEKQQRMVAPVIIGTTCASADQNGCELLSVPAPSPCATP